MRGWKWILVLSLVGCTPTKKHEEPKATQPVLTQKEAVARFDQVSNVEYDQEFWLDGVKENFTGKVDISFDWKPGQTPLRLDFFQGVIKKATVNGTEAQLKYDGLQLTIDSKYHKEGRQHVVIEFERAFDPEANGLYRFVDPQDKKVYLYSNLEPNYANVIFPCFDQPDLKATFKMRVHAPQDWVVSTSTLPDKTSEPENGMKTWDFPTSAKMATYVWSLHAGPYAIFEDKTAQFPTRIFVRQTLKDQVRVEEWFPVTKAGLKFYGEFFGITYPYKKMDLVMVPDFNWGGMENIAAIALTENELKKGPHTKQQKMHIASLLLHEIAHMWFGDLVTMKWWDDLWLNESFATFMEGVSLQRAGYKAEAWRDFFRIKQWAYQTDDRVTTHPIAGVVSDTTQALTAFDGITYGKGASTMKQLMYLISEEKFRDGVHAHFQAHQNGNAVLADFMGALSKSNGKSLDDWTQQWLKTSGVNTAKLDVTCENGKIASAKIHQSAPKDHPVLREQAMRLAFLNGDPKLEVKETFRVVFSGDHTELKELTGKKCPRIILPNYEDHGYAKFEMDEASLNQMRKSVGQIKDPFPREIGWYTLWAAVTDGEWSVKDFANLWLKEFPGETDEQNIHQLVTIARGRYANTPSILMYYPPGADLDAWRTKVDAMLWAEVDKSKAGSDRQMELIDGIISLASQPSSLKRLADLLDGKAKINGFEVDQKRRWLALKRMAANNFEGISSRIDDETKRDSSSDGVEEAIAAKSAIPIDKVKEESLASVASSDAKISFTQRKTIMGNLFPEEQNALRNKFGSVFFKNLDRFVGKDAKSDFFLEKYMALAPVRPGKIVEAEKFLSTHPSLPEAVKRALKELVESGERLEKVSKRASIKSAASELN